MEPLSQARQIIDFCLAPLSDGTDNGQAEVRRRLEHVIKTYQSKIASPTPVAVDFSKMPSAVINEAAHGYE